MHVKPLPSCHLDRPKLGKVLRFDANSSEPVVVLCAVEPMDDPTDGQLLAYARHFFKAADRVRGQAHT